MRFDALGMFWEDTAVSGRGKNVVRVQPPIPDTGWTIPRDLPNLAAARVLSIDTETYDPDLLESGPGWARGKGHIVGVSVGADGGGRWYFPMRHEVEPEINLPPETVLAWLRDTMSNRHQPKVGANLMYDYGWLLHEGVRLEGELVDVQFAEALLDERAEVALEVLAQKYLGEGKESNLLYKWCSDYYGGKPTGAQRANIYRSPARLVGPYAESDADLPIRLAKVMYPKLVAEGLFDLFRMECRLIPLLVAMRFAGVHVDISKAEQLRDSLKAREDVEAAKLKALTGVTVDINSSDSLAKAFDAAGLSYTKTAKGNPSFTKAFLKGVQHPIADSIREIRKLTKLRGTFVESYILNSHVNGMVYGQFHPMRNDEGGTRSGRFSSCLPDTAKIMTTSGELLLSGVVPGTMVATHTGQFKPVINKWFTGNKKTYKICLSNGRSLVCTSNHRLLTSSGWLSLEHLYGSEHAVDELCRICGPSTGYSLIPGKANYRGNGWKDGDNQSNNRSNIKGESFSRKANRRKTPALFPQQNGEQESNAREIWGGTPLLQRWGKRRKEWLLNKIKAKLVYWGSFSKSRTAPSSSTVRDARLDRGSKRVHRSSPGWGHNEQSSRQPRIAYFVRAFEAASEFACIERVEFMGVAPVFDLEVEADHCFVADGIFVHNSTPNLQNLPSRDEELAPMVRGLFIPDAGHFQWRKYDYSQIEYRFLAHYAVGQKSDEVRQIYVDNPSTDYHEMTRELVRVETGQLLDRRPIKNINFGLIYGMGVDKLSADLGLTSAKGKELFASYHKGAPFAKATMDCCSEEALNSGVITTILGRKSRFDLWEPISWKKSDETLALPYEKAIMLYGQIRRAYTHKALNRRLQGSAADLMKVAMLQCWDDGVFAETGVPRLTVHDELDHSDPGGKDEAFRELRRILESALTLRVPIKADCDIGPDWGHVEKLIE